MAAMRIGVLGAGSIGGFLARNVLAGAVGDAAELSYVFDIDENQLQEFPARCRVTQQSDLFESPVDLVVEAVTADVLKTVALRIVERSDLLLFSVTSLADDVFRSALEAGAIKHGRKVFLPHGAIVGLDGLVDAGPTLEAVTVTTTKSPASLGLLHDVLTVVYEGPVREACVQFPRNVNVHAAVALAGLGFDRTISRIVADPDVSANRHVIEITGTGYHIRIDVSSEAGGKITGAYTPQSALGTVRRICRGGGGLRFA